MNTRNRLMRLFSVCENKSKLNFLQRRSCHDIVLRFGFFFSAFICRIFRSRLRLYRCVSQLLLLFSSLSYSSEERGWLCGFLVHCSVFLLLKVLYAEIELLSVFQLINFSTSTSYSFLRFPFFLFVAQRVHFLLRLCTIDQQKSR